MLIKEMGEETEAATGQGAFCNPLPTILCLASPLMVHRVTISGWGVSATFLLLKEARGAVFGLWLPARYVYLEMLFVYT